MPEEAYDVPAAPGSLPGDAPPTRGSASFLSPHDYFGSLATKTNLPATYWLRVHLE